MSRYRFSLIVVGLLAFLVLIGGWFIGVQPQLDRISTANTQTDSVRQLNQIQQAKNTALAEDDAHLDEYKAQLASTQAEIPAARSQQALIDQINAAAGSAGVTMTALRFEPAQAYVAPVGVSLDTASSGTLVAIAVSLSAQGERAALESFTANLQASTRLITVIDSQYTGPEDAQLTLNGATWVLVPLEQPAQ